MRFFTFFFGALMIAIVITLIWFLNRSTAFGH